MVTGTAVLLLFVAVFTVSAQTFQYSRGWTNGKRDGGRRHQVAGDVTDPLDRPLTPCHLRKLKYLLEGKPLNEKFYAPCEYHEDDVDAQHKSYRAEHGPEPLFEVFQ
ncbi:unnamed protein product, partial [Iphiclides podalirius]